MQTNRFVRIHVFRLRCGCYYALFPTPDMTDGLRAKRTRHHQTPTLCASIVVSINVASSQGIARRLRRFPFKLRRP